jgi:hypothetical protein
MTIFSAAMIMSLTSVTSAHYLSTGYDLYSMTYKYSGENSEYVFYQAAKKWSDSAGTTITADSRSDNYAYYDEYLFSWYGQYTWYEDSNGDVYKYRIRVNKKTILEDYPNDELTVAIGVAVHEFGHAQFLDDIESGYGDKSIMSYERDRVKITDPQQHDLDDLYNYRN